MLSTNTTVVFSSQKLFNSNKHLVFLLLHSPINSLARYLSIQLFMRAIPIARFVSKSLCFVTDAVFLSWSINPDTSAVLAPPLPLDLFPLYLLSPILMPPPLHQNFKTRAKALQLIWLRYICSRQKSNATTIHWDLYAVDTWIPDPTDSLPSKTDQT